MPTMHIHPSELQPGDRLRCCRTGAGFWIVVQRVEFADGFTNPAWRAWSIDGTRHVFFGDDTVEVERS